MKRKYLFFLPCRLFCLFFCGVLCARDLLMPVPRRSGTVRSGNAIRPLRKLPSRAEIADLTSVAPAEIAHAVLVAKSVAVAEEPVRQQVSTPDETLQLVATKQQGESLAGGRAVEPILVSYQESSVLVEEVTAKKEPVKIVDAASEQSTEPIDKQEVPSFTVMQRLVQAEHDQTGYPGQVGDVVEVKPALRPEIRLANEEALVVSTALAAAESSDSSNHEKERVEVAEVAQLAEHNEREILQRSADMPFPLHGIVFQDFNAPLPKTRAGYRTAERRQQKRQERRIRSRMSHQAELA